MGGAGQRLAFGAAMAVAWSSAAAQGSAGACPAGAAACAADTASEDAGTSAMRGTAGAAEQELRRLYELLGPPRRRDDSWLRSTAALLAQSGEAALPTEAARLLEQAADLVRGPLLQEPVLDAWAAVSQAARSAPGNARVAEAWGRFAVRYYAHLVAALGADAEEEIAAAATAVAEVPGAGEVQALLMLAQDGRRMPDAIGLLRAAVRARPSAESAALLLAVAFAGMGDAGKALTALRQRATTAVGAADGSRVPDARLLATFGFLAATSGESKDAHESVLAILARASKSGTRGGVAAAMYRASLQGQVPFPLCDKLYKLERDLLFAPSSCEKRLELGVLLRGVSALPKATAAGMEVLSGLAFDCPRLAEQLSGMGKHWLEGKEGGITGLGRNLHAVADIRRGIKDASYATWAAHAEKGILPSKHDRWIHLELLRAADAVGSITTAAGSDATLQHCQQPTIRPSLAHPGVKDKLGCPNVKPSRFVQKCLQKSRPCVLRGQAATFLRERPEGLGSLDRWVELAENVSVRVSFPFPTAPGGSSPTLNSIALTEEFFARKEVHESLRQLGAEAPDATAHPWTLVRPAGWNMRLRDAVTWVRRHPRKVYMNQQMLADLGSPALSELRTPPWVEAAGLKLLSPSLWMASGIVTTGYHTDGPENLLAQLSGEKDVLLARPSEKDNLYYQEVADVQADMELGRDGSIAISGLLAANRTSAGHSVVDIAGRVDPERFPRYAQARGMSCHLMAGDVLYIPSGWHHAVLTTPDTSCVGLSLNLWYLSQSTPI